MANCWEGKIFWKRGFFGVKGVAKIAFLSHILAMGGRPRFCLDSEWEGAESELRGGGRPTSPNRVPGESTLPPPNTRGKRPKKGNFCGAEGAVTENFRKFGCLPSIENLSSDSGGGYLSPSQISTSGSGAKTLKGNHQNRLLRCLTKNICFTPWRFWHWKGTKTPERSDQKEGLWRWTQNLCLSCGFLALKGTKTLKGSDQK